MTPLRQRMLEDMQVRNLSPNTQRADVENVARSVVLMASLPLDANVQFLTVMATKMPFVGRG